MSEPWHWPKEVWAGFRYALGPRQLGKALGYAVVFLLLLALLRSCQ